MEVRKSTLYLRVNLPDGSRRYCKPVYARKGELKAGYALINKKPVETGGLYHARYVNDAGKRVWHNLGADPYIALDKLDELERMLRDAARRPKNARSAPARPTVANASRAYLERVGAKLEPRTYAAYSRYQAVFKEYLGTSIAYLDEINADILEGFETFLYRKYPATDGKKPQTPNNVFAGIRTFLRDRGHLCRDHYGKDVAATILAGIGYDEKIVDSYEPEQLQVFFDSCIETEYLKMSYFLQSGCREQEVAHAELCDLDPKTSTLHVQPKPHRQWKVKDKEDRFIPLPVWLVKRLLELHAGKGPHQLLFPNSGGNVEGHFLRQIQQIALRAGLNCGSCESTVAGKPITCEKNACCSRWSCHAFRRTYATIQHEILGVSVRTIQKRLGHASLEVTQRYLKATDAKTQQARDQAEAFGAMFTR